MNVKAPNQNVIPFPKVEGKSSLPTGFENHAAAVRESFGEILEREFQVHTEKKQTGSEYKTIGREKEESSSAEVSSHEGTTKQELNSVSESQNDKTVSKESASIEESEETEEEEDLDRDALEYSLGLVATHADWDRTLVPANQLNEMTVKEKTVLLSLQKSAEKTTSYSPKEGTAFIDEAKKLAMSFFQTEKGSKPNEPNSIKSQINLEKDSNLVLFPKAEKKSLENKKTNEKLESVGVKKESIHTGSVVSDFVFAKGKEVKVEGKEILTEHSVRKVDGKIKTNKQTKNGSETGEISSEQEKSSQTVNSDKMIRSLGVKDKEFQKQDSKVHTPSEKQKQTEASFIPNIQNSSSSKSGEEGGRSFEERGSKQGFSLSSFESKSMQKTEDIRSLEKQAKPKETNLKQNIDELIKQARFDIVQNGKSSAEIIMNPKEYGRLTLKVTVDGDKVEGRILVESEELQKSLQNEIQTIKENLKESGLDLQALIVDLWDDGSGLTDRREQNELYQTMVDAAKFRNTENNLGLDESLDLLNSPVFEETKAYEFFA
ncbi:flagellar hook-length control protein FliK [Leptospira sp. 2 VSF19]|uniref:Flagellar hook-length control protein FliK n=1 Tax=Leptospira soteropolitanensis TaxID=2950025 RepID=A0AAW5VPM8_9LEPT|nr:flagellar hook-length control protein FliK [Leptospira soteropolitanensis]MCW7494516.1 flagellar hook-length control protein FliK [Leptospira soteropolitanensis]MCW7502110.1 flagellar hook-length control protein FliK [Leptospira soteropolitanensis]MCW7524362.1 flagellar hook-length control protein FliK [Leptospira soteropolitanensis]MCW7528228.1 flagellar hook-length control protein FliK [Leptospira soteropolitanensis]MCW7532080.1 flagellar hook-length control protein FliK [Leptospira soter